MNDAIQGRVRGLLHGLAAGGFSLHDAAEHVDARAKGRTERCNPAHRSAPLAMRATLPDPDLAAAAIIEARLTHLHPLTGGGDLSDSGLSPDALRAAVHFVGSSDTLSAALDRSIEFAGPANYCPVLVGSIGGARWGAEAVPSGLLEPHSDLLPRLGKTAETLALGWRNAA